MFSKKKQEDVEKVEEAKPIPTILTKKQEPVISKDNYGDEDKDEAFINSAGKVGKAQHNYLRQAEKVQFTNANRAISLQQLSQHKTAQSAWLSLNGIVYDVTNYMKYHPGGRLILQGCGAQCADLFNKYHPWVNGQFLLKKYKLGYLMR